MASRPNYGPSYSSINPVSSPPILSPVPHHPRSSNTHHQHQNHAFGAESDLDEDENDSDDGDDPGFAVYKDSPSNPASYSNLARPRPHHPSNQRDSNSSRAPLYPPQPNSHRFSNPPVPAYSSMNPLSSPTTHVRSTAHQDLVQMPALGSDWEKDESKRDQDWDGKPSNRLIDRQKLKDNTIGMISAKLDQPKRSIKGWLGGEHAFWGWLTRWVGLGIFMLLLILAALLLFFLIPRPPTLFYNSQRLLNSERLPDVKFNRISPNSFEFQTNLNLAFDAQKSYVGVKVSSLQGSIKDLSSVSSQAVEVATGNRLEDGSSGLTVSHKNLAPFSLRMKFAYTANSDNDTLWNSWYAACGHQWPGNSTRPTIQLGIIVNFKVAGLIGDFSERTVIDSVACPVELSANAA